MDTSERLYAWFNCSAITYFYADIFENPRRNNSITAARPQAFRAGNFEFTMRFLQNYPVCVHTKNARHCHGSLGHHVPSGQLLLYFLCLWLISQESIWRVIEKHVRQDKSEYFELDLTLLRTSSIRGGDFDWNSTATPKKMIIFEPKRPHNHETVMGRRS